MNAVRASLNPEETIKPFSEKLKVQTPAIIGARTADSHKMFGGFFVHPFGARAHQLELLAEDEMLLRTRLVK